MAELGCQTMTGWPCLSSFHISRLPPENHREICEQEREAEEDRGRDTQKEERKDKRKDADPPLRSALRTLGDEWPRRPEVEPIGGVASSSGRAPWKSTLFQSWFLTLKPSGLPLGSPGR